MWKKQLFPVIYLLASAMPAALWGQIKPMGQQAGVTRAVIVGVSEYQNERIPRLQYAHADADAFAAYLRSPAGGALPASHIKLLTNKQATQGQMAAALTWLLDESKENDVAVIYFSGHGDMETQTVMNQGFLLTYDAPASTYMAGGAFPVMFLQAVVQTLSTQKKVQVILITDACHAGKLAGNATRGAQATAQLLAEQFANEARLLSCQPDEFSTEGAQWGGGHGVFTFYLLDGLTGLADANNDGNVNLLELQRFLEDKVPAAVAPASQIPLVFGNKGMKMAKVDQLALAELKERRARESEVYSRTVALRSVASFSPEDSATLAMYRRFKTALDQKRLLYPEQDAAYTLYMSLKDKPAVEAYRNDMRLTLAAALQDDAQQAINDYLAASPLELRRRWSFDTQYEQYPEYLNKAAEILGQEHFMYHNLITKSLYFHGLNLRLRGEKERDRNLYQEAEALQHKVLAQDPNAAYAYNELGLLARRRGDFEAGIDLFQHALALSPTWVLAHTNLCGTYLDLDQLDAAVLACQTALDLDSTFSLAHHNLGASLNQQSRYAEAIAALETALRYDSLYAGSYFLLGNAYYFSKSPEKAVKAWLDAHRLSPTHINTLNNLAVALTELGRPDEAIAYYGRWASLEPESPTPWLEIAELQMAAKRFPEAQAALDNSARLDPALPDTDYLRGRLYALQNQPQLAVDAFQSAMEKGFTRLEMFETDKALDTLRKDKRFKSLMKRIERK